MVFGWFSDRFLDSSQVKIDLRPSWKHLKTIVHLFRPSWKHLKTIVHFWHNVPVRFPDLHGKLVNGET